MRRFSLALLLLLFAAACGGDGPPDSAGNAPPVDVTAPPGGAVISFGDSAHVSAEIADESEEWRLGLMFRERMDENAGMIFFFPIRRPGNDGFHMKNTLISLSIAYMRMLSSTTFEVVAVRDMHPCPPETAVCPEFPGGEPYDAALEVNQGWFEEAGIDVGDSATVRE